MVCITKDALSSDEYKGFYQVINPLTKRDIATLAEVLEIFLSNNTSNDIEDVLTDNEGHFLFLINDGNSRSDFDFYDFINRYNSDKDVVISCVNIKQMYPKNISLGEYMYNETHDDSTSDMEDNVATGYIEEADLRELQGVRTYKLEYIKSGAELVLSERPQSIGRSAREADFIIQNNTNVSRRHCIVYVRNGIPYIKDNKSLNGTFVEQKRLKENIEEELHPGDTIYVADEKFVLG